MSNYLTADTDHMNSDIQSLAGNINMLNGCISRTEFALSRLNTMWEGSAKTEFINSAKRDIQEMRNVVNMLTKYKNHLEQAKKIYDQADTQASDSIAAIKF